MSTRPPHARSLTSPRLVLLTGTFVAALASPSTAADLGDLVRTYVDPQGTTASHLGHALAVDGDWLVIGDPFDPTPVSGAGSVHVVRLTTGALVRRLVAPDPVQGGSFGWSVDVRDGRVLVGEPFAPTAHGSSGRAYLFDADTGVLLQRLEHLGTVGPAGLGRAVVLGDDVGYLGAPYEDQRGVVHVHALADGAYLGALEPDTPDLDQRFGEALALDGGRLAVGAPWANGSGAVSLFDVETLALERWVRADLLLGTSEDMRFGTSLALEGDRLLVGAPRAGFVATPFGDLQPGAAYLVSADTGALLHTLVPPPGEDGRLGDAVDLQGDLALASAPHAVQPITGYVHLFDAASGAHTRRLHVPDPDGVWGSSFGDAAVLAGNRAVVGAPSHQGAAPNAGAVYVLDVAPSLGQVQCAGVPNSTGVAASLEVVGFGGHADVLTLRARRLPADTFGLFLVSATGGSWPQAGGGQGTLCLGFPVGRALASLADAGAAGWLEHDLDPAHLPFGAGLAAQPGETWHLQAWYRDVDAGGAPTSNLSAAVAVTFP